MILLRLWREFPSTIFHPLSFVEWWWKVEEVEDNILKIYYINIILIFNIHNIKYN
jgi:hypothetical protein